MSEKESIVLAALLHDIGKFWERTEYEDALYSEYKDKLNSGDWYSHAVWSANFARSFSYLFSDPELIERLLLNHHRPEIRVDKIIHIADRLSAKEREETKGGVGKGRSKTPLVSIFSQISLNKPKPQRFGYSLNKLELRKIFPKEFERVQVSARDYYFLWYGDEERGVKGFKTEINEIKKKDDIFTIYHLLKKYTSFIPSSTAKGEIPDISLFDHLKTTSAIASCLYIDNIDEKHLDVLNQNIYSTQPQFLLLGGDVCGIQRFIYSLTSKGALKGLRGRSFYIGLLSETISKYILAKLKLFIPNLLYCEGGRFYILAPLSAKKELKGIYKEIEENLLSIHQGDLSVVMSWISLSPADFALGKINKKWGELNSKLEEEKRHKFSEVLDEKYEDIFEGKEEGGEKAFCQICGSEEMIKEEEGVLKCENCRNFEKVAKPLAEMKFLVETKNEAKTLKDFSSYPFREFKTTYYFISTKEDLNDFLNRSEAESVYVYSINSTNFLITQAKDVNLGFRFLLTHTPFKKEDIKTFEDFAGDSKGTHRWGVLRMDVDSLGKIFSKGLKENASVSRLSTLSSMLSLYFSGWVEEKIKNYETLYGVYSGGDDLFIVGSWNVLPEIAKEIYQDFRKFTCENPNITLSGGIYIAPSTKFPLYISAKLAGYALDKKSKELPDKDAITFLDTTTRWTDFEKEVKIRDRIIESLEKGVSRALLYALSESIFTEYELRKKGKVPIWKVWKFFYVIRRFMERHKEAREALLALEEEFRPWFRDKPHWYGAAAIRWAELLTRKEG